ncbi:MULTISPECIES: HD domain-containing phosphohydrolase [Geobacillus]|uniref:Response regulator n=2 Tax=Geobacillus TaxID=129337 RepID=A0A1Q5SZ21_9BACL|nr:MULTISPECIES: HD domain-containing phosphohydrolase [Geobacillus]OKO93146.1 Response regulator [Geobacillus proteiniphilus]
MFLLAQLQQILNVLVNVQTAFQQRLPAVSLTTIEPPTISSVLHPVSLLLTHMKREEKEVYQPIVHNVYHERIDGKGYPDGLTGDDIPLFGKIIAVADAFDAMTSDRPYRKGMDIHQAADILRKGKGTQWDGELVDLFLKHLKEERLLSTSAAS